MKAGKYNFHTNPFTQSYLIQRKCTTQHDTRVNLSAPSFYITSPGTLR